MKENYIEFKEEIKKRKIEYLIHFTPTINLYSILENRKLLSRAKLESLDIKVSDILDYAQFTDNIRYDDKNYINLSISSPNTFLLKKFKEKTKDDFITWCILKIDPKYVYINDTLFSVTNAASSSAKYQYGISNDIDKFKLMFKENISIQDKRVINRNLIKDKYPTDIQAEVLVKDEIFIDNIIEVCFESEEKLAEARAAMSEFDTSNFIVDNQIFSPNRNI
ncbi:DarT ssDNA thymidine ADP-ribosyltransferase family protein [Aureivirga marina]|uniref:DarT ssDNA thymidine ADP-ribosyltransferase family protein n=1 Tax=Aureivirga marina TaxID=1182451 RepID=UPI001E4782D1|nr:DarT ssDNA thymidine ADP-ribosyltransferase family protein [Aureivirga marina]